VTLFAGLTLEQKAALLDRSVIEDQPEGHVFMKHAGELRNELHIVVMGQVLLGSGGRIVQTLQPGDYFGEVDLATIGDQTVIAEEPTTVLRIKSRHFQELNLVDKLKFTRGVAKSGGYHKAGPGPDGSSSQIPKMAADSADSDPQPDVSRVSTSSLPTIPEVSEEGGYAEDTDDVKENAEGIQTTDNLNLQEMSFPPKPRAEQSIQEFSSPPSNAIQEFSSPPSKRNSKTQWDDERCAPAGVFCSGF